MLFKRLFHNHLRFKPLVDLAFTHIEPSVQVHAKPTILMLHGLFGSRKNFHLVSKSLSKDLNAEVYTVDLRNHGQSAMAKPYDYVTLTNDVVNFVDKRIGQKRPISIIGFSLGGRIGLLSALSRNINVKKCISIDMPPYSLTQLDDVLNQNYEKIKKIEAREIKIRKGTKQWKDEVLKEFKSLPANTDDRMALYFANGFLQLKDNSRPYDPRTDMDPYLKFNMPLLEMPDLLEKVKEWPDIDKLSPADYQRTSQAQTLFMRAMRSDFIKKDYSMLAKRYPRYSVQEFDTGHVLIGEEPKLFYESVLGFISDPS